jgi:hypothetical protein
VFPVDFNQIKALDQSCQREMQPKGLGAHDMSEIFAKFSAKFVLYSDGTQIAI